MTNFNIIENLTFDIEPRQSITLHVDWNRRQGELSYTIYYPNNQPPAGDWHQPIPDTLGNIENFWTDLNQILNDAIPRGSISEEAGESICLNLQGLGSRLFNELIPSEVVQLVREWQPGFSVRVSTNEKWIPWELMHDGQDFWGNRFIIARSPRVPDRRTLPDISRPESQGLRQIRGIVNVIGGDIPATEAQRASQLFNELLPSIPVTVLQEIPVSVLAEALPGADVLHCTCHGHLQPPPPLLQIYVDTSPTQNLCLDTVQTLETLEPGSLVFANACSSNSPVSTFRGFSNFGWEFYRQGADVFIGTLGIVPAQYAVNFAENVYRELLREDGRLTIGQAVARAKEVADTVDELNKREKRRNLFAN